MISACVVRCARDLLDRMADAGGRIDVRYEDPGRVI